jgi:TonB family protein
MTARSPGAFILSTTFHVLVIGVVFLLTVVANDQDKVAPRVLELVAGEGDNFGADVAPALGTPDGVKLQIPEPVAPYPEPVAPPQTVQREPEPTPVAPTPPPAPVTPPPTKATPAPAPAPPKKAPSLSHKILNKVLNAENKAKKEIAKERAEDERRAKAAADKKAAAAKVQHIDAVGIAKGVYGGSTDNTVGGAGGKSLTASGEYLDRYFSLLKQRVLAAMDKPAGVNDDLAVVVSVYISATGQLSNAKVVKSSGDEEFDHAVVAAFSRVEMPEHPEHKGEPLTLRFTTKDVSER